MSSAPRPRPGLQVECNPSANVSLDIDIYRAGEGGYVRLAVENAAGGAAVQSVELRKSPGTAVSGGGWVLVVHDECMAAATCCGPALHAAALP